MSALRLPAGTVVNRCEVCEWEWRDSTHSTRCYFHKHYVAAKCQCGADYFRPDDSDEDCRIWGCCVVCRPLFRGGGTFRDESYDPPKVYKTGRNRGDFYMWDGWSPSFDNVVRAYEEDRNDGPFGLQ